MNTTLGIACVEKKDFHPFGRQTFYFEDMINLASHSQIDIFFFSPLVWNFDKKNIPGYRFKEGKWQKAVAPFPKIIYDRSFANSKKEKKKIEEFRIYLKNKNISVLNPIDLANLINNKIEFHKFLSANKIPTLETMSTKYMLSKKFMEALERKKEFYLKPIFGTGGLGIFVISKTGNFIVIRNNINTSAQSFGHVQDLLNFLSTTLNIEQYFIQPKADIIFFEKKPFDIRVIVQNYGRSDYRITGIGVRVGQENSFVSNLNSGGSALPLDALSDYYKQHFHKNIFKELQGISKICVGCCKLLDNEFGSFLEIGFDILLTRDNGPVVLEGNSKPSRWIFNLIAEHSKDSPRQFKKYFNMRQETVKVPILFAERNFPLV